MIRSCFQTDGSEDDFVFQSYNLCILCSRVITYAFLPAGCAAGSKGCRFPGAPAHSSVFFSDDLLGPETVATYSCERGFELLGPARRVCGHDGQWTPEGIPFCGESYSFFYCPSFVADFKVEVAPSVLLVLCWPLPFVGNSL